ncbi:aminotransferase class III-fold pyridoxal phosphate-dependent enzyme [Sinorhizobium meliloti]|uniref:aminotransferase class III-fold pyridoxal phosphate-dependent enzyme n=1 Tax=Rhizobium meliloti TaxID=382 RepID=UPI003F17FAC6
MEHLLRPSRNALPPIISHGERATLYDTSGRDYIDGSSGAMVANLGHGIPEIAEAAAEQMRSVAYTYRTQFRNAPAEKLASSLVRLAKDKSKAFFLSSGSEATEAAIRLILQYWQEAGKPGKRRILSRRISYHGNTLGALTLSSDSRRQAVSGLAIETSLVPPCYCYRCPLRTEGGNCNGECATLLEDAIEQVGAHNVAAFLLEPIVGASGGAIVPHSAYFAKVREICDRHDILLVVDEVITGLGRTGKWFAMHHWNVSSDITILGKGLNAGFTPLSALLLSERVVRAIENGSGKVTVGHTHSGNPASTAICSAVIDYIESNDLVNRAAAIGEDLGKQLRRIGERFDFVGDVRGLGLLWGIEFVADRATKRPFDRSVMMTDRIVETAFANGLIVYPCRGLINANEGSAILVAPPLTTSARELELLLERLHRTFVLVGRQIHDIHRK